MPIIWASPHGSYMEGTRTMSAAAYSKWDSSSLHINVKNKQKLVAETSTVWFSEKWTATQAIVRNGLQSSQDN